MLHGFHGRPTLNPRSHRGGGESAAESRIFSSRTHRASPQPWDQILTVHRKDLFSCRPLLDMTLWNLTPDHERLSYPLGLCFSIEIFKIYPPPRPRPVKNQHAFLYVCHLSSDFQIRNRNPHILPAPQHCTPTVKFAKERLQAKPDLCRGLCAHTPPWKSRPCAGEKGGKRVRGASLQGTGLFSQW